MAQDKGPGTSRAAAKGESLWQDAWRRLQKNKMAMFGLVVTVVMSLTAIFAGTLSPYDPEVQQRWTGALPPWTQILSLRNEIRVSVGARPLELEVPEQCDRALGDGDEHVLAFELQKETLARLRVTVNGGNVEQIQLFEPGKMPTRPKAVELANGEYFRSLDGTEKYDFPIVAVGRSAPAALGAGTDRAVVQIIRVLRSPEDRYRVECTFGGDGKADKVLVAGEEKDTVTVVPGEVLDVTLDGKRLEQLHVLGTDQEGRDALSRVLYGGRISLLVGITATIVSLVIGVLYGAVAGYVGGRTDAFLMRIVDILFGLPYLFVVILMMVAFGRSILILFVALGALQWLTMARIVRGQVLSLREKEFVDAAITVGTSGWNIILRHLIPNVLGVVVVYMTLTVPAVILQESFLAFLGLTVEWEGRPLESWGALVNYGREALGNNGEFWWLLLWPSIAMSLTLFSLNFLGDGLRDAFDPQQRGRN